MSIVWNPVTSSAIFSGSSWSAFNKFTSQAVCNVYSPLLYEKCSSSKSIVLPKLQMPCTDKHQLWPSLYSLWYYFDVRPAGVCKPSHRNLYREMAWVSWGRWVLAGRGLVLPRSTSCVPLPPGLPQRVSKRTFSSPPPSEDIQTLLIAHWLTSTNGNLGFSFVLAEGRRSGCLATEAWPQVSKCNFKSEGQAIVFKPWFKDAENFDWWGGREWNQTDNDTFCTFEKFWSGRGAGTRHTLTQATHFTHYTHTREDHKDSNSSSPVTLKVALWWAQIERVGLEPRSMKEDKERRERGRESMKERRDQGRVTPWKDPILPT